jgi:hypothetical protein
MIIFNEHRKRQKIKTSRRKFKQASKLLQDLEKARKLRIQERESIPLSSENPISEEIQIQTIENSKNTASLREPQVANNLETSNPRPSTFSSSLRRLCCCFKSYRVIPDATITIEK